MNYNLDELKIVRYHHDKVFRDNYKGMSENSDNLPLLMIGTIHLIDWFLFCQYCSQEWQFGKS